MKMRMDARQHCKWNLAGNTGDVSLPFSPDLLYGSRPPVQAPLRLASLGLDGARPRSEGNYGYEKMAGSVLAVLVRLPLVGTEHPAVTCT